MIRTLLLDHVRPCVRRNGISYSPLMLYTTRRSFHPSRRQQFHLETIKRSPKAADSTEPKDETITTEQLRILALRAAIPMIGFGFMDNLVMIQAGELIDLTLGVTFSLSTLTAAGFGQVFSDMAGVSCGGAVDAAVSKLRLPYHRLSVEQMGTRRARLYQTGGSMIGVVIGCLLGMSCLLFMDTDKADRMKKAAEMDSIFKTVMERGNKYLDCERCSLWLLDQETHEVWTKVATGTNGEEIRLRSSKGLVGACIETGEIINVLDAYQDPRFSKSHDVKTGYRTHSVVVAPILSDEGRVLGAIQMLNKNQKPDDETPRGFSDNDLQMLQMLTEHVANFTETVLKDQ